MLLGWCGGLEFAFDARAHAKPCRCPATEWTHNVQGAAKKSTHRRSSFQFPQQSLGISVQNFTHIFHHHAHNSLISIQLADSVWKISTLKWRHLAILARTKTPKHFTQQDYVMQA